MKKFFMALMAVAAISMTMTSCDKKNEPSTDPDTPAEQTTKRIDILFGMQYGLIEATDFTIQIAKPGEDFKTVTLDWKDCKTVTDSWFIDVVNAKVATCSVADCKTGDKIAVKSQFTKKADYTATGSLSVAYNINFKPEVYDGIQWHWEDLTAEPDQLADYLTTISTTKEYTVQ